MNIKVLGERVLVEPAESQSQTPSGLVLPENAQEKSQEGTVVVVGQGRWIDSQLVFLHSTIKIGNRVLFAKYSGVEIVRDGKKYLLLNEKDVLAILDVKEGD